MRVKDMAPGEQFRLVCNPAKRGVVVRQGEGSTIVRYGTERVVSFTATAYTAEAGQHQKPVTFKAAGKVTPISPETEVEYVRAVDQESAQARAAYWGDGR